MRRALHVVVSCLTTCLLGCVVSAQAADTISIESLLNEMVDRTAVARFPDPAYVCKQSSSYDRGSDKSFDQPLAWFANADRSHFVRIDEKDGKKEFVLHDVDGPGTLVRIWMTWHGPGGGEFSNGTLRVYIDGAEKPAIEGRASEVLDQGLLAEPPISQGVSPETPYAQRGHNLYLPIPYAKHCKVTYSTDVLMDVGAVKGEALYYQINYRTYDPGTKVESFSMDRLQAAKPLVDSVNKQLAASNATGDDWQTAEHTAEIQPGSSSSVDITGNRAIRMLQCQLAADDIEQALRSTVLEIAFDGEQTVWCPVGDFVGTGYKLRPFKSWYTEVQEDGTLICRWVMPFKTNAKITLHNLGKTPVTVDAKISHSDWQWDDSSMHFHSTWHQLTGVETGGDWWKTQKHAQDVNFVTVNGKGVYVGDTLTVLNGAAAWWGEGDEKVYVDGEKFPSHFGTGTEDYYGYAWCRPEYFSAPFHAQPDGGGNIAGGYSVNCRYRSLDAIPFTKAFRFDMELWHWAATKMNYAPTTFWYALPGAVSGIQPDPKTAALPVAKVRADIVDDMYRVPGVIEGEGLRVVERTGGSSHVQARPDLKWSSDCQLWWMDAKPGDKLVLEFPVGKAGRYQLLGNLTKAADYGIVTIAVNDTAPQEFDRYNKDVKNDDVDLGTYDFQPGNQRLTVTLTGTNPAAEPRHMFGVDYLKLAPK